EGPAGNVDFNLERCVLRRRSLRQKGPRQNCRDRDQQKTESSVNSALQRPIDEATAEKVSHRADHHQSAIPALFLYVQSSEALVNPQTAGQHLILYDGVCGLCNGFVKFLLPRDPRGVFDFASLQSEFARSVLRKYGKDPKALDVMYAIENYRSP